MELNKEFEVAHGRKQKLLQLNIFGRKSEYFREETDFVPV